MVNGASDTATYAGTVLAPTAGAGNDSLFKLKKAAEDAAAKPTFSALNTAYTDWKNAAKAVGDIAKVRKADDTADNYTAVGTANKLCDVSGDLAVSA